MSGSNPGLPDTPQYLMQRRDGPGLLFLGGHLLTPCLTGILLHLSLGTWWVAPAVVLHGVVTWWSNQTPMMSLIA